jgi:hypothetical protein
LAAGAGSGEKKRHELALTVSQLEDVAVLRSVMTIDPERLSREFAEDRIMRRLALKALCEEGMGAVASDDVQRLAWGFLDEAAVWQFQADAGWTSCSGEVQAILDEAKRNRREQVDATTGAWTHQYSLADMSQTNRSTGKRRPLRLVSPWAPVLVAPRWQYSTRFGWTDCDLEMQALLAEALAEAENSAVDVVRRTVGLPVSYSDKPISVEYDFNFKDLTQTNVSTRRERRLRYGPPIL